MTDINPHAAPFDRERMQHDAMYRVEFDRAFLAFTKEDEDVLHAAAPLILPVVTEVVEGVYEHLFTFTNTKKVFLKREHGYEGELVTKLEELTLEHPQMVMRRKMLSLWAAKILTADFQSPVFWQYLDKVGEMHTGRPAFAHRLNKDPLKVDLQYLSLTLSWITDVITTIVMNIPRHELSSSRKLKILRAWNKAIAIQQDLFQRHYIRSDAEAERDLAAWQEQNNGDGGALDLAGAGKKGKGTPEDELKRLEKEKAKKEAIQEEEETAEEDAKKATDALPDVQL
ncbi:hypothetical protein JCM10207_001374 [Rhodosporidiobolus poonsookiae]